MDTTNPTTTPAELLSCGHPPTTPRADSTTGYATIAGTEERICFGCAADRDRLAAAHSGKMFGYLSSDEKTITTWPGLHLADVTYIAKRCNGGAVPGFRYTLRAVTPDGADWYGSTPGPGMYARLRRTKGAA